MSATHRGRNDARGYRSRIRERAPLPQAPSAGERCPTPAEQRAMHAALDQMLADERQLRAAGHNPTHPALYVAETVAIMDAVIDANPVDPDAMFRVLDLLDQYHRTVEALDVGRNEFNRQRRAMRDAPDGGGTVP